MPPHFETVKSFADVPISENGVDTHTFLEASDGLVKMFDLLGSGVFGFVQADIRSNISGVRARYEAARDISGTLEHLVEKDVKGPQDARGHATACLVRLIRGLVFTCRALQNAQNDKGSELHACFKRSYDEVLRHHHTFVVRSIVSVAIRAVPRRGDFYMRIAQGGSMESLETELGKWLVGLDIIVQRMQVFLAQGGYGQV